MAAGKATQEFNMVMRQYEEGKLRRPNGTIVRDVQVARAMAFTKAREVDTNYGRDSALTGGGNK